jgi:KaiC/GvpD/RAD55 family RecA-like ATPase
MQGINNDLSDNLNDEYNTSNSNENSYSAQPNKNKLMLKDDAMGNLPPELLKFVKNDTYSLLVKGKPGTGKTTFALTLMDNLNYDSNYFYISTRLSIRQLLYFYPWITKFTAQNESKYEYKFEDARLDEPESLFERITNQLMDVKSPIIIIDTWDAIALFMDRESRLNNERVLQIWRERAGAKLIFLSESPDLTLLDSIVDGVITLRQEYKKPYTYRELFFNKLRGISIDCSKYYFSLLDGVFFALDSSHELNLPRKIQNNELKYFEKKSGETIQLLNNKYKTNGLQRNVLNEIINNSNIITLDFDSRISNELILSLLSKPLFSWIVSEKLVLINNFQWSFYSILKKILLFFVSPDIVDDLLMNEKLDFFKIVNDYVVNSKQNKSSAGNTKGDLEHSSLMDSILSELVLNTSKNFNYRNILNIVDGNNTSHLFSNLKIIDCLKGNPNIHNLIIIKNNYTQDENNNKVINALVSEGNYFKIILKGKNIIIKSISPTKRIFGAFIERNGIFIDWYPLV